MGESDRTRVTSHVRTKPLPPLKFSNKSGTKSRSGRSASSQVDKRDRVSNKSSADQRGDRELTIRSHENLTAPQESGVRAHSKSQQSYSRASSQSPTKNTSRSPSQTSKAHLSVQAGTNQGTASSGHNNGRAFAHDEVTVRKLKLPRSEDDDSGLQAAVKERLASFWARKVSAWSAIRSFDSRTDDQHGTRSQHESENQSERNMSEVSCFQGCAALNALKVHSFPARRG